MIAADWFTTFKALVPLLTSLYGEDADVAFEPYCDTGREYRKRLFVVWGKRDIDGVAEFREVLAEDLLTTEQGYAEAKPLLEARIAKRDSLPFRKAVDAAAKEMFGGVYVTVGEAAESGDEAWAAELIPERGRVNFPTHTEFGPTPIVALARLLTWMENEHANRTTAIRSMLEQARKAVAA